MYQKWNCDIALRIVLPDLPNIACLPIGCQLRRTSIVKQGEPAKPRPLIVLEMVYFDRDEAEMCRVETSPSTRRSLLSTRQRSWRIKSNKFIGAEFEQVKPTFEEKKDVYMLPNPRPFAIAETSSETCKTIQNTLLLLRCSAIRGRCFDDVCPVRRNSCRG